MVLYITVIAWCHENFAQLALSNECNYILSLDLVTLLDSTKLSPIICQSLLVITCTGERTNLLNLCHACDTKSHWHELNAAVGIAIINYTHFGWAWLSVNMLVVIFCHMHEPVIIAGPDLLPLVVLLYHLHRYLSNVPWKTCSVQDM